jgi:prepilin-type N-terminal cleavage/methylation domain-containing protein
MNRRMRSQGRPAGRAAGFTLVELLVVVAIIVILAGMALGGLAVARNSARQRATHATIAKLNNVVLPLYDSYRNRRVPLSNQAIQQIAASSQAAVTWYPYDPANAPLVPFGHPVPLTTVALIRLAALRDIMRMELPERPSDIINPPLFFPLMLEPSLHRGYATRAGAVMGHQNGSAECLYMIVTMALGEEARQQFGEDEVGDTDGNGLPEFLDGWGRPIYFLRWAPGFNQSDLQQNVPSHPDQATVAAAAQYDHDPLDPRRVDPNAFRLVPLIYSPGSDGVYDVWMSWQATAYVWQNRTYVVLNDSDLGTTVLVGTPFGPGAFDNVHNHRLEVK